ncbi:unnamed protein product [Spirodela intermedia]|uniref:Uncharacterized protein n=1 Tax=Spirodela intermedia TaxID=51605 RepID=A0A7I8IBH5_SPIIN|nr:unnamed protein product [Spirodela intermedia]CAA6655117.1 unnamed protein product [Spirodela intermedia]
MSRNGSKRVTFSPDASTRPAATPRAERSLANMRAPPKGFRRRLCRSLPGARFFKRAGENAARALCFIPGRRRGGGAKVSPRGFPGRLHPASPQEESHTAEAIEDCIRFINSSSTRKP